LLIGQGVDFRLLFRRNDRAADSMTILSEHHHLVVRMQDGGDIHEPRRTGGGMAVLYVIPIEKVVDSDLPVAVDDVLLNAVDNLDRAVRDQQSEPDAADFTEII